ncbi:MAG: SurA N-terminal domain-containing protein [Bacillota bacterium]
MNKETGLRKWTLRLACLTLTLLFGLGAAGCALNDSGTANTNQVIAKVGSHEITYGEFKQLYDYYAQMYASYGMDVSSDPTMASSLQSGILNSLVQDKVLIYQAEKQGFTKLSAEQQAELDERIKTQLDSINEYYRSAAEAEAAESTEEDFDVEARAKEMIKEDADSYYPGKNYTAEQYLDLMTQDVKDAYYTELLKDSVTAPLTVSDDEVTKWYNEYAETLKSEYTEDATLYMDDMEEFEANNGQPVVYAPAGYSRIMDILIAPEDEPSEEYTANITELDTLKAECGELYIEQANGTDNSARIAEIVAEYNKLKAETDQMETDRFKDVKAKIDEAYGKLQSGTAFADVMAEYTQNTSFTAVDAYKQKGMLIGESDDAWSEALHEQFKSLAVGQYSQAFKDDDGYHIIYRVSDVAQGATPVDEVKTAIHDFLLAQKQDEEWNACIQEWSADGSVIIDYNRLSKLGISISDTSSGDTETEE